MNRAIRYIMLALVLMLSINAAQAQFRRAAVVGGVLSDLNFKQDLATVKSHVGFQAGIQSELIFPGIGFGMDFALLYNMAGAKVNLGEKLMWSSQGYGNETLLLHQISIPFHLRFKYTNLQGVEETIAPLLYVGPDININVAHSQCKAMTFAGGDVGLTFGAGAELFKNWQLTCQYSIGMTYAVKANILKEYSARTRQWAIRLSYFF